MGIKSFIKTLFRHRHKWVLTRTICPYPEGYGVRCDRCGMVTDTGLSKEGALDMQAYNKRNHP